MNVADFVEYAKAVAAVATPVFALLAALLGFVSSRRAAKAHAEVQTIRVLINGRMDSLIEASEEAGRIRERDEQRALTESEVAKARTAAEDLRAQAASAAEGLIAHGEKIAEKLMTPGKTPVKPRKQP